MASKHSEPQFLLVNKNVVNRNTPVQWYLDPKREVTENSQIFFQTIR